jgi:hypothetical protein
VGVGGAHITEEAGQRRWREGALVLGASDGAEERRLAVGLATPQNPDAPEGALRQGQGRRHKAPGRGARQFSKLRDCRRVWHLHALA